MNEILKVKIDRHTAGNRIPYDVVYLFPRNQRSLIARLFDYALVMPFEDSFKEVIFKLPLSKVSHLKQYRDDDAVGLAVQKTPNNPWDELRTKYALDDRLVVVPLLMSKGLNKYKPRYITSKQWFIRLLNKPRRERHAQSKTALFTQSMLATDVAKVPSAVSDLAYLLTPFPEPENIIRPICSICPRNLQHLQGQCIPGMQVCYETLNLNLKANSETTTSQTSEETDVLF